MYHFLFIKKKKFGFGHLDLDSLYVRKDKHISSLKSLHRVKVFNKATTLFSNAQVSTKSPFIHRGIEQLSEKWLLYTTFNITFIYFFIYQIE